jgi:hypothetical protein
LSDFTLTHACPHCGKIHTKEFPKKFPENVLLWNCFCIECKNSYPIYKETCFYCQEVYPTSYEYDDEQKCPKCNKALNPTLNPTSVPASPKKQINCLKCIHASSMCYQTWVTKTFRCRVYSKYFVVNQGDSDYALDTSCKYYYRAKDLGRYICSMCSVGYQKQKGDSRTICQECEVAQQIKCPMCLTQPESKDDQDKLCSSCREQLNRLQEHKAKQPKRVTAKPKLGQRKVQRKLL